MRPLACGLSGREQLAHDPGRRSCRPCLAGSPLRHACAGCLSCRPQALARTLRRSLTPSRAATQTCAGPAVCGCRTGSALLACGEAGWRTACDADGGDCRPNRRCCRCCCCFGCCCFCCCCWSRCSQIRTESMTRQHAIPFPFSIRGGRGQRSTPGSEGIHITLYRNSNVDQRWDRLVSSVPSGIKSWLICKHTGRLHSASV